MITQEKGRSWGSREKALSVIHQDRLAPGEDSGEENGLRCVRSECGDGQSDTV